MKKLLIALTLLTLPSHLLFADVEVDTQDVSQEKIKQPAKRTPFSFDTHLDVIGQAEINHGFYKDDKIDYAEALAEAGMVFYYNPLYTEGAKVSVGYSATYLHWHNNPWFEQDRFDLVKFTFSGFTQRAKEWFWRTQVSINCDTDDWSSKYTSYDLVLWGRYAFSKNIGLHFGFWGQTGLQLDRIYPILGFDWKISEKWKLNFVYPVNIALNYQWTPRWSIAAAVRFFNSRFRVKHSEHTPKPLVRYTNVGAEIALKYDNDYMSANIHAGSALYGKYRVATHHNCHANTYYLNASYYAGAEVDVKF